jgi:hypothetical protein
MPIEFLAAKGAGPTDVRSSHGLSYDVKGVSRTVEIGAAASINSTYDFAYIPSNARILGLSRAAFDILGAGVLLDIGLFAVDGNFTSVSQALNDSIAATAAGVVSAIKDIANYGKRAWEIAGLAADPSGAMLVRMTLRGAQGAGGTITLELLYTVP